MIRTRKISNETTIYFLIFILGLCLRFFILGGTPLTDSEAQWAFSALELPGDSMDMAGSFPGYTVITSFLITLFGSSNFIARLLFALLGGLVIWVPFAYRERLGRVPALVAGLAYAVGPGFIAGARIISSPGIGVSLLLLGFALWKGGKHLLSGIVLGASLLFGPSVITGLLGIALALGLSRVFRMDELSSWLFGRDNGKSFSREDLGQFVLGFIPALLLVSTGFFRYPSELGAAAGVITGYLDGWSNPAGQRITLLLGSLAAYQFIPLIFGTGAVIRGWLKKDRVQQALSIWLLGVALAVFLYPSVHILDLIWLLPPLWMLAAMELARYIPYREKNIGWIAYAQMILIVVLFVFLWLNITNTGAPTIDISFAQWRMLLIGIILLFGAISTIFIGLGWRWVDAVHGLVWGSILSLAAVMISFSFKVILPSQVGSQELWSTSPLTGQAELMVDTINELSVVHTGREDEIDIVSVEDAPSIRWALRDFHQVSFLNELGTEENPTILLTRLDDHDFQHSLAYRGQDFTWWRYPAWETGQQIDWVRWITLRETPESDGKLILWARGDLFPDFEQPAEDESLLPEEMDMEN